MRHECERKRKRKRKRKRERARKREINVRPDVKPTRYEGCPLAPRRRGDFAE
jgi:hypothetical protein